MYGLLQAGIIAQLLLEQQLAKHGYRQSKTTPGFWKHNTRPISFSLIVNNFGVKYVGEEHAQHLLETVQKYYKCSCDWAGERYCGLTIKCDYPGRKVHLSMPGYIPKALLCFKHPIPTTPQDQPYPNVKPNYGAKTQHMAAEDTSPPSIRREKKLFRRFAELFFFSHTAPTEASSRHLAPLPRNKHNRQRTQ
jgi:hypothetical protein